MRILAALLLLIGLSGTALTAYAQQTTQELPPTIAPEVFNRARDALNNQDFDQAVVQFSLFILLNPTYPQAYFGRALSYESLEKNDEAIADLSRVIDNAGDYPDLQASAYMTRADLQATGDHFDEALDDYGHAITLAPTAENYTGRALVYLTESQFEAAVSDLDEAIDMSATATNLPALYFYRATAKNALDEQAGAADDYLHWVNGIAPSVTEQNPLEAGQSVTLDMVAGAVYKIPFKASAGDTINVVAANLSGDVDPLVVLTDADGNALAGNDGMPNGDTSAVINGYQIETEGFYNLLVTHSISGYTGRIVVLLDKSAAQPS